MLSILALLVLSIAFCASMLLGGGLFIVGFFIKNRKLRHWGMVSSLCSALIVVASLSFASAKVVQKIKAGSLSKIWQATINTLADDTGAKPLPGPEAKRILSANLGNPIVLTNVIVEGVWIDRLPLAYGYFIYHANEQELLKAVSSAPTTNGAGFTSDQECKNISWEECEQSMLTYIHGPQHNLPGWHPELIAEKRCYRCLRFPFDHIIVVDPKTGTIYHSVSEIRD